MDENKKVMNVNVKSFIEDASRASVVLLIYLPVPVMNFFIASSCASATYSTPPTPCF